MPTLLKNYSERTRRGGLGTRKLVPLFCLSLLPLQPLLSPSFASAQESQPASRMPMVVAGQSGSISPTLQPGELIDFEVFNTPELSAPRVRIDQDGNIAVPVLGNVKVSGLTPLQANALIEQRLRDAQIMTTPSVSILVTEYATRGVDVVGQVKAPGIYMFIGQHTLNDALAAAGGVSVTQGGTITVTHQDDPSHPVVLNADAPNYSQMQSTIVVQPGDVVEVSRAEAIYVVGDVNHSGQFPIANGKPLTALKALALAQGATKTAKLGSAAIVRKTANGGAQTIPVDLRQVEKASLTDPILLPDDILVIPRSGLKAFLEIALPNATSAVVSASVFAALN